MFHHYNLEATWYGGMEWGNEMTFLPPFHSFAWYFNSFSLGITIPFPMRIAIPSI